MANKHHHKYRPHRTLTLFMLLGYIILAYWLLIGQFSSTSYNAYVSGKFINITPNNQGYITSLLVKQNDLVIKGQPIATIDNPYAYITLKNAEEKLTASIQQVTTMYHVTYEIQSRAQKELQTAEENFNNTQKTYQILLNSNENQTDFRKKLKQAQIKVEKAASALDDAHLQVNAAMSLPNDFNIYQNPIIIQAMDELRSAYFNWLQSIVYAPETGYINQCQMKIGDKVNPNTPLMNLVPLNEIWVNAEINKAELRNIRYGQPVNLTSIAYGDTVIFKGNIVGINPEMKNSTHSSLQIQMDPAQLAKYPLRPGLGMIAAINTKNRSGSILTTPKDHIFVSESSDYREQLAPAEQVIQQIVLDNTKGLDSNNMYSFLK